MKEEGVELRERGVLQKGDAVSGNAPRRRLRHLLNEGNVGGGAPRNGNAGKAQLAPFLFSSIFIFFSSLAHKKLQTCDRIGSGAGKFSI